MGVARRAMAAGVDFGSAVCPVWTAVAAEAARGRFVATGTLIREIRRLRRHFACIAQLLLFENRRIGYNGVSKRFQRRR